MYIEKQGKGEAVVLLHGWGMNSLVWQPLIKQLAGSWTTYAVDLPGYGYTDMVEKNGLDSFCERIADSVPENAHWLGWSMGGLYALEFSQRCPGHQRSLSLLASNPKFVALPDWSGVESKLLERFSAMLFCDPAVTIERFLMIQAMGIPQAKSLIKQIKQLIRLAPLPIAEALAEGLAILKSQDFRENVSRMQLPLHMILGERDKLVPVSMADDIRRLNDEIAISVVPSASHAPFLSHTNETSKILTKWWSNL